MKSKIFEEKDHHQPAQAPANTYDMIPDRWKTSADRYAI